MKATHRCRVIVTNSLGWNLGPGSMVNLDEMKGGVRLRDVTDPSWFELIEPEALPFIPPAEEPSEE